MAWTRTEVLETISCKIDKEWLTLEIIYSLPHKWHYVQWTPMDDRKKYLNEHFICFLWFMGYGIRLTMVRYILSQRWLFLYVFRWWFLFFWLKRYHGKMEFCQDKFNFKKEIIKSSSRVGTSYKIAEELW